MLHARLEKTRPEAATRVRVGGHAPIVLPAFDDPDRDAAVEQIAQVLEATWRQAGAGLDVKAEIRLHGRLSVYVPHGDVVAVLDAFRRAGVDDVAYRGARLPYPPPITGGDR